MECMEGIVREQVLNTGSTVFTESAARSHDLRKGCEQLLANVSERKLGTFDIILLVPLIFLLFISQTQVRG